MKSNIIKVAFLAMITVVSVSCEGFFNQVVTLDIPPQKPVLVINSLLNTDSVVVVGVSNSVPALGAQQAINSIKTAQITLTADGTPITDWAIDSVEIFGQNGQMVWDYFYKTLTTKPIAGKTYKLTVAAVGYETVDATYKMPSAVVINALNIEPNARMLDGESFHRITFTIPDNGSQKDFYGLSTDFSVVDTTNGQLRSYFPAQYYSKDLALRENRQTDPFGDDGETVLGVGFYGNTVFTDVKFNGTNKVFELFIASQYFDRMQGGAPADQAYLYLILTNYSVESYRYLLQSEAQNQNSGNPFGEPVQVVTNINKGLGIFAGKNTYKVRIN